MLKKVVLFLVIVCVFYSVCLGADSKINPTIVRVHLMSVNCISIAPSDGTLNISTDCENVQGCSALKFSLSSGGIVCDKLKQPSDKILISSSSNAPICINKKNYCGSMSLIRRKSDLFYVINNVDMEYYLIGVLGGEEPASWPIEALKAQAVAARTYAFQKKLAPRNVDFDVFSTTQDQVYVGYATEFPSILKAVSETSGQILTFDSKPIQALFHSSCGGETCSSKYVFGTDFPYLQSVKCDYCSGNDASKWSYTFNRTELSALLNKQGLITGELYDIKILGLDSSNRVSELSLITSDGEKKISGADFRMAVGAGKQRSTKYGIEYPGGMKKISILLIKTFIKTDFPGDIPISENKFDLTDNERSTDIISAFNSSSPLDLQVFPTIYFKTELISSEVHEQFCFSGNGWGHGVGMCQWGSYGMAKNGASYSDILYHYYPGTALMQISDLPR